MSSIHPHTQETGHKLIICGRKDEWEGFCFDCCLQYIFGSDDSVSVQQRCDVKDLLNNCVKAVESEVDLESLDLAVMELSSHWVSHQRIEKAMFAFLAVDQLSVAARIASRPATFSTSLRDLMERAKRCMQTTSAKNHAQQQLCAALYCRTVRRALVHCQSTAVQDDKMVDLSREASRLLLQLVKAFVGRDRADGLQTDASVVMLRTECVACISTIVSRNSTNQSFCASRTGSAEQLVDFVITELSVDYTNVLSALWSDITATNGTKSDVTNMTVYQANLFQLLAALVQNDHAGGGLAVEVVTALVSKKARSHAVPQLARAAVKLGDDAHVEATTNETSCHLAGLRCILSLLEASARCVPTTSEHFLSILAQRLLADDCHYSSQLFGLWSSCTSTTATSAPQDSRKRDAVFLRSFHFLAMGCPARFYHYSVFTVRVFDALVQRFDSAVRHSIYLRRLGVGVLPMLGGGTGDDSCDVQDETLRFLGQLLRMAIERGACGAQMLAATLRCCAELVTQLQRDESRGTVVAPVVAAAAVVAGLSHVLPLVSAMQQAPTVNSAGNRSSVDSNAQKSAPAWCDVVAEALKLLSDALLQLSHTLSAKCRYERDCAVLHCLRCINKKDGCLHGDSSTVVRLQVIVSHVCAQNSTFHSDEDTQGQPPPVATALAALPHPSLQGDILDALLEFLSAPEAPNRSNAASALYHRGYDCRTLHRTLAEYVLSQVYSQYARGRESGGDDRNHARQVAFYARFIGLCCAELCGGALLTEAQHLVEVCLSYIAQVMRQTALPSAEDAMSSACRLVCSRDPREQAMGVCAPFLAACLGCSEDALRQLDHAPVPPASFGSTGQALLLLWLTQLANPSALCQQHHHTVRWIVNNCQTAVSGAHGIAAPVLFTFDLLLCAVEGQQRQNPAQSVVPDTAENVAYYWSCCTVGGDNQSDTSANRDFAAVMLPLLWERAMEDHGNTELVGLQLQLVKSLPLSSFSGLLPVLVETAERLSAGMQGSDADASLWEALVLALQKQQLCAQMASVRWDSAEGTTGVSSQLNCSAADDVLMILQRAVWYAQTTTVSGTGDKEQLAAAGELHRVLCDVSTRLFNAVACAHIPPSCKQGFALEADRIEDLCEYLHRSSWRQLQMEVNTLAHSANKRGECPADRILSAVLCNAMGEASRGDVHLLCAELEHQLSSEDSAPAPTETFRCHLSNIRAVSDTRQAEGAAGQFCTASLLAALHCCEGQQASIEDRDGGHTDARRSTLLRCWLLRAQEVLLACGGALHAATPPASGTDSTHHAAAGKPVETLREIQRCAVLYCSAHLHSQRLRDPQAQPQAWHLLWLRPGTVVPAENSSGVYAVAQEAAYSERCGELACCGGIAQLRQVVRGLVLERAVPLQRQLSRLQARQWEGQSQHSAVSR